MDTALTPAEKLERVRARLAAHRTWTVAPPPPVERDLTPEQIEELRKLMGVPMWVHRLQYDSNNHRLPLSALRTAAKVY